MANDEQLSVINQGVDAWNKWRDDHNEKNPYGGITICKADLSGANLRGKELGGANLSYADLRKAELGGANLSGADLSSADLRGVKLRGRLTDLRRAVLEEADLRGTNLRGADLRGALLGYAKLSGTDLRYVWFMYADLNNAKLRRADLREADLCEANLSGADLRGADLRGANLMGANLVEASLENANLTGCRIYGISAWNLKLNQDTKQSDLIITHPDEATVTVSDLEVAQFIYLLLNRKKLRNVLDTITSKAVLLLGRFTAERKPVLDALADELRKHNLLPIIFDFERSTTRDFTETIKILAGLSMFVIVDITKPKSVPQELSATVPDYQIPFVPILEEGEDPYSMFVDFKKYDWVLKPVLKYRSKEVLLENFRNVILERAWKKHLELQRKKNEELEAISIEDMIKQKEKEVSS